MTKYYIAVMLLLIMVGVFVTLLLAMQSLSSTSQLTQNFVHHLHSIKAFEPLSESLFFAHVCEVVLKYGLLIFSIPFLIGLALIALFRISLRNLAAERLFRSLTFTLVGVMPFVLPPYLFLESISDSREDQPAFVVFLVSKVCFVFLYVVIAQFFTLRAMPNPEEGEPLAFPERSFFLAFASLGAFSLGASTVSALQTNAYTIQTLIQVAGLSVMGLFFLSFLAPFCFLAIYFAMKGVHKAETLARLEAKQTLAYRQ